MRASHVFGAPSTFGCTAQRAAIAFAEIAPTRRHTDGDILPSHPSGARCRTTKAELYQFPARTTEGVALFCGILSKMMAYLQNTPRRRMVWAIDRSSEWWDVTVPAFTNEQWLQNFRMTEQTFLYLCNKLRPVLERQHTSFRMCVPLQKRVAIALWRLATGSEYASIGRLFGVGCTTVCRCVREFCSAAETFLVPEQIRLPDEEQFRGMAADIENRWGLPQCVGAIDACHIPILSPQHNHNKYLNHNGWHSIILQGVVDGNGLFWNVFAGLPGSLDDARVLRLSTLWELASRGNLFPAHTRSVGTMTTGYYILGDSPYPLLDWLLKPFHDNGRLPSEQQMCNHKFRRVQLVAESAFRKLKGRWQCLLKKNECQVQLVKSTVLTCCALHNLCESNGDIYETLWDEAVAEAVGQQSVVAVPLDVEEGGGHVRDALMKHLLGDGQPVT
ncbi:uncharacterized protein [Nothobranchius furzeri]|uniref:uncharacterized protein isoform X2 n=1 Tax=Nothobranchius furzeri TaxID=105023 RepID=UPI0024042A77|nr:uncharacterized protein LOC107376363 isoform X2 [Nothobranchius furzeri]